MGHSLTALQELRSSDLIETPEKEKVEERDEEDEEEEAEDEGDGLCVLSDN